ncbi:MAG: HDOD domain-containing protein [Azoarcus sp.]|nr:HDOD domain-containing protein [Azoarcus sp.]
MSILEKPLASAEAYVAFLATHELPVLRQTARQIEIMSEARDSVNARQVAAIALGDPLFAVRLIVWMEDHRHRSQNHDITTVERAIMMIGVDPFFEAFTGLPTVEDTLADRPRALIETLHMTAWARKAAHLARDWAILRHDIDVDEVALATLLRPVSEILLWMHATPLLEQMQARIEGASGRAVTMAYRAVLGCSEHQIQIGLAQHWHLPQLLVTLMDETHENNPRVRNVALALAFARAIGHAGWDSPALSGIVDDLARLLPIHRGQLLDRLGVPADVRERWESADD